MNEPCGPAPPSPPTLYIYTRASFHPLPHTPFFPHLLRVHTDMDGSHPDDVDGDDVATATNLNVDCIGDEAGAVSVPVQTLPMSSPPPGVCNHLGRYTAAPMTAIQIQPMPVQQLVCLKAEPMVDERGLGLVEVQVGCSASWHRRRRGR